MEPQQADAEKMPASAEAAQRAVFIEKGNELLNKAKEVAQRIRERCRHALRANPDSGKRPPSKHL
jgi:hypothetical protein